MVEVKTIIDFIQSIGFIGLLIILAVPRARSILGFDNGITPEQLKEALTDNSAEHPALLARIPLLCTEQVKIRQEIERIAGKVEHMAEDLSWVRGKLDN